MPDILSLRSPSEYFPLNSYVRKIAAVMFCRHLGRITNESGDMVKQRIVHKSILRPAMSERTVHSAVQVNGAL
ncbi:hypothetical protein ACH4UY_37325 [Streptomyces longwoodensis]|uniref:hypothetical protein n=1 Tax=Streptomyces longwoodensis TaxID=68231 RepID=UPI0037A7E8BD